MKTRREAVAKAIVEATSGPWDRMTKEGQQAALHEADAAIDAYRAWRPTKTKEPSP